jgi:hypothetical protein
MTVTGITWPFSSKIWDMPTFFADDRFHVCSSLKVIGRLRYGLPHCSADVTRFYVSETQKSWVSKLIIRYCFRNSDDHANFFTRQGETPQTVPGVRQGGSTQYGEKRRLITA